MHEEIIVGKNKYKTDLERENASLAKLKPESVSVVQKIIEIPKEKTRFRCMNPVHSMVTIVEMNDSAQRTRAENRTISEFICTCGTIYRRRLN